MVSEQDKIARKFQQAFSTDSGQEVLDELRLFCGYDAESFSTDTNKMAYNEGKRSVYLRIKWYMDRKVKDE